MRDRKFLAIAVLVVVLILHGSLYPYAFRMPPGGGGPITALLATWTLPPGGLGDLVANILLYAPFGLFAALAIGRPPRTWAVTLAGLAICTTVELLQFYDMGRVTRASDIYLNTLGTWIGAIVGSAVAAQGRRSWLRIEGTSVAPLLLIVAFLGYRLYPYVPTIDLNKYWHAIKPVFLHPNFDSYATFRFFAIWLTVSYLAKGTIKSRSTSTAIPVFAGLVLAAKVLIVDQSVSLSEILGAALAISVWLLVLRNKRWGPFIVGCILCAAVIGKRMEPFHFLASHREFSWIPFQGFLQGSLAVNIQSFFEKVFLYGSLVWIASARGTRLWLATVAVAALLFVTSLAEIYLPGRSAEITDTIMVLILGGIFGAICSRPSRDNCSARAATNSASV